MKQSIAVNGYADEAVNITAEEDFPYLRMEILDNAGIFLNVDEVKALRKALKNALRMIEADK